MERLAVNRNRIRRHREGSDIDILRLETERIDRLDRHPLMVFERKPEGQRIDQEGLQLGPRAENLRSVLVQLVRRDVVHLVTAPVHIRRIETYDHRPLILSPFQLDKAESRSAAPRHSHRRVRRLESMTVDVALRLNRHTDDFGIVQ